MHLVVETGAAVLETSWFEDETIGELTVYGCFLWRVVVKSRTDWVCCVAALTNQSHRFVRDFANKQSHSHPFTELDFVN
jgi:hypothetical protein